MRKRIARTRRRLDSAKCLDPLKTAYFFQELPQDIKNMVFEGIKFHIDRQNFRWEINRYGLDTVLDDEAENMINTQNYKMTIKEWLEFGDSCERMR